MEFTLSSIKPWMRWPLFKWKIRRFCKASPLPASFESGGGGRKKFFLWRDHFLLILNIVMPLYSKLQKKHVWFFYSSVIHIIKLILGCHPYHADSLSRIGQLSEMDAIKKKMQSMKVEKDAALDRADVCEQVNFSLKAIMQREMIENRPQKLPGCTRTKLWRRWMSLSRSRSSLR